MLSFLGLSDGGRRAWTLFGPQVNHSEVLGELPLAGGLCTAPARFVCLLAISASISAPSDSTLLTFSDVERKADFLETTVRCCVLLILTFSK